MLVLADSEFSNVMSTESSMVPHNCMTPGSPAVPSGSALSQSQLQTHSACPPQCPPQPQHQWDINDSTLPVPDVEDNFELWPSGHCRRVYRGDSDDARRHVSGWAMRNTNNHNALILKKSCLGVLVCSLDCLLDCGRKVHLRPAICDKARRKQIGKPCPNPGCSGKLDLLSCRGHCGYPVTHFWRHLGGRVYFQAKGYHDHPRPEVKSLSEKGRNAFSKQLRHEMSPALALPLKRRLSMISPPDSPEKKMFFPHRDDVMCSCSPFECVCPKPQKSLVPPAYGYYRHPSTTPHSQQGLYPPRSAPSLQSYHDSHPPAPTPFTQINITNTCLPPPSLDLSIPGGPDPNRACSKLTFSSHALRPYQTSPDNRELKMYRRASPDAISALGDPMRPSMPQSLSSLDQECYRPPQLSVSTSYVSDVPDLMSVPRPVDCNEIQTPGPSGTPPSSQDGGHNSPVSRHPSESSCQTLQANQFRVKSECGEGLDLSIPSYSSSELTSHGYLPQNPYSEISPVFESRTDLSPSHPAPLSNSGSPHYPTDNCQPGVDPKPTYITLSSPKKPSVRAPSELQSCRLSQSGNSPSGPMLSYNSETQHPASIASDSSFCEQNINDGISTSPMDPKRCLNQTRYGQLRTPPLTPARLSATGNEPPAFSNFPASRNPIPSQFSYGQLANTNIQAPPNVNFDPCMSAYQSGSGFQNNPSVPFNHYCNDVFPGAAQQQYRNPSINITLTYN